MRSQPVLILCLVTSLVAITLACAADKPDANLTAAEVESLVGQLKSEQTRLAALEKLIPFASMRIFQGGSIVSSSGNAETDALMQTAADAVAKYHDFNTISLALKSRNATLQFWAMFHTPDEPTAEIEHWQSLLPRIRELARDSIDSVRGEAQRHLRSQSGEEAFLTQCVETETSVQNIMFLLRRSNNADLGQRLSPHVFRLLSHKNEAARYDALIFIGFNSHRAPMWRITFEGKMLGRVVELSRSQDEKERAAAVYALTELRKIDPTVIRNRMIELVKDPSAEVRWRIPDALKEQLDRADVQAVLAQLLKDESPTVRYFTVMTLGPATHLNELQELSLGADPQIAVWAATKLKQIAGKHSKPQ